MPTAFYQYDPLNRLLESAGSQRFYNKSRLATEIQGEVRRSVFQVGHQLLAEGGSGVSNLLATDLQRSVLHTVNPDKCQPMAYNVYGHRPAESGLSSVLGFNGERADPVTGHYMLGNGYRAFNPVLMRFNSPDSWSPFGKGGINAYGYCGGDAINFSDPTGHVFLRYVSGVWSRLNLSSALEGMNTYELNLQVTKASGVPITTFESLQKLKPDVYAAIDYSKNKKRRVNIQAHGYYSSEAGGYLTSQGEKIVAEELHRWMRDAQLLKVDKIRLMICYSGNGGANGLAGRLHELTGVPVTAYSGLLATKNGPRELYESFAATYGHNFNMSDTVSVLRREVIIKTSSSVPDELRPEFEYRPVHFGGR